MTRNNTALDNFNTTVTNETSYTVGTVNTTSYEYNNDDYREQQSCCSGFRSSKIDEMDEIKYYKVENKYVESFTLREIIENKLEEPINYYDPIVYHDPTDPIAPFVVKLNNTEGVEGASPESDQKNERVEAIMIPIVRLNTIVLNQEEIEALSITFTKFIPELTLIVTAANLDMFPSRPGLNNMIHVVIMPSTDGKYKKISLPFYITNVEMNTFGNSIKYTAILKHMPLIQHLLTSEAVNYPDCPKKECNHPDSSTPNMWELFHEIARRTGLGFAAQVELQDYTDRTARTISSHNYKEFLEYNIEIGGSDENHIYDGWVDPYGYLTLVDVYKLFHCDVTAANLAMFAETGIHTTSLRTMNTKYHAVRRILTNSNMTKAKSNIEIVEFYNGSNMGKIHEHGTLNTMYYFCPFGNNGINNINAEQIRIKENSADGEFVSDYEIAKYTGWTFVGCEDINISRQMEIRNAYMTELRNSSRALTVKLAVPNFALQRGTLVTIVRFSFDLDFKNKMFAQESNLYPDAIKKGIKPDESNITVNGYNNDDIIMNDGIGMIVPQDSGIYYIDGMRFDYMRGNNQIDQYLYLIRRGPLTGLDNLSTLNRMKYPTDPGLDDLSEHNKKDEQERTYYA